MKLAAQSSCTGCGACIQSCPKHAIYYCDDNEGFPVPHIEEEKCVECGICKDVCPAIHISETNAIQAAYAVQMLDQEALKDSTSGGLFTVFSREIFRRGGVVYGCVWDENYNAVVRCAENEEDIKPMRGSKYVWSWAGDTFPEIKAYLQQGREVLFMGLPCQVAGLKNYLHREYDNLYLVDFFCGGVPSPLAFQEYLKTISNDVPLNKLDFKFRDKERFGAGVHISYRVRGSSKIYQSYVRNPYYFSFYTKLAHRKCCYHCQYRYEERIEDLTVGDYWGVEKFHNEFNVRAGVSALLVNTNKGANLLKAVRDQLQISPTQVENIAVGNNLTLGGRRVKFVVPENRDKFFHTLKTKGWPAAERRYLYNKNRLWLWLKTIIPYKYKAIIKRVIY